MGARELARIEQGNRDPENIYVSPGHRRGGHDLIGPAPGPIGEPS